MGLMFLLLFIGGFAIKCGAQYSLTANPTSVVNGSSVTFSCATPDVDSITWFYGGPPKGSFIVEEASLGSKCNNLSAIPDNFAFTCSRSARNYTLTISSVTCDNAGVWRCQDRLSGVSNEEVITVTGDIVLSLDYDPKIVNTSTLVTVTCQAQSCTNVTDIKLSFSSDNITGTISYLPSTTAGYTTVIEANTTLDKPTTVNCTAGILSKTILIDVQDCDPCKTAATVELVIILVLVAIVFAIFVSVLKKIGPPVLKAVFFALSVISVIICLASAIGIGVGCHAKCLEFTVIPANIAVNCILCVILLVLIFVMVIRKGKPMSPSTKVPINAGNKKATNEKEGTNGHNPKPDKASATAKHSSGV